MIPTSKLYTFIDQKKDFTLNFLEGQKLISDLVIQHDLSNNGLKYFRKFALSLWPVVNYLKDKDSIGIYIESESPYLRFKFETNAKGLSRTLISPEDLSDLTEKISGICRVKKIMGPGRTPYNSFINFKNENLKDIINKFFSQSYQREGHVFISNDSDQSILVDKLPAQKETHQTQSVKEFWALNGLGINNILKQSLVDEEQIIKEFEKIGFSFLTSKEIKLKCGCSKQHFVSSIKNLQNLDLKTLFDQDQNTIETKCDYCKKKYLISKKDLGLI